MPQMQINLIESNLAFALSFSLFP